MLALQHYGNLEKDVIIAYLRIRGEAVSEEASNEEIYLALMHILQIIENGGRRKMQGQGFGEGIWVD